jgi:hypothetical protein
MNDLIALLAASLLAVPPATPAPAGSAEARAQVEELLGAIDTPVAAGRWKALGPDAVPVLVEIASSGERRPSVRAGALSALSVADSAQAESVARALVDAPDAPLPIRRAAVRTLGHVLGPAQLRAALAPVLRAAPVALRSVAAETLALHAGREACAEVMDQISLEPAAELPRFERAAALCAGRR